MCESARPRMRRLACCGAGPLFRSSPSRGGGVHANAHIHLTSAHGQPASLACRRRKRRRTLQRHNDDGIQTGPSSAPVSLCPTGKTRATHTQTERGLCTRGRRSLGHRLSFSAGPQRAPAPASGRWRPPFDSCKLDTTRRRISGCRQWLTCRRDTPAAAAVARSARQLDLGG
jgi:hypothetical protein